MRPLSTSFFRKRPGFAPQCVINQGEFGWHPNMKDTQEIEKAEDRIAAVVGDFTGRENWQKSAIITPLNEKRVQINEAVHGVFQEHGIIDKEDHACTIRTPVSFSNPIDRHFSKSYDSGQRVFLTEAMTLGSERGPANVQRQLHFPTDDNYTSPC